MNNYEKEKYNHALKVLGLKSDFTYQELHNRKRVLLGQNHPDKHKEESAKYEEISKEIAEAFYFLNNKLKEKEKEKEAAKANELKIRFTKDLNNILKKYSNYKNVENLCKTYLDRISRFSTLDELEIQKKEFDDKFKVIKEKITFDTEKNNFKIGLSIVRDNKNVIQEEKKLATLFLEKLENVYDIEQLKKLQKEYQDTINQLRENIKKTHLEKNKNLFERELLNLKKVYVEDIQIIEIIDLYLGKLKNIKDIESLENLKNDFFFQLEKIKNYKLQVSKRKRTLFYFIESSSNKYKDDEYAKIFDSYRKKVDEFDEIEDLDKLEEELINEITKINALIQEKNKQFLVLKDKVKRACIYNFYKSTSNHTTKWILKALDVLKNALVFLEVAEMNNFNTIIDVLENISYKNLEFEMSKLNFLDLTKECKIIISDKNALSNLLKRNNIDSDTLDDDDFTEMKERRYIKDKILKDQYNYATNNNFEKIRESIELLKKTFRRLDEMNDLELMKKYSIYERVDFKNIEETKLAIKDLSFSNDIYLRLKTGDICLLEEMRDEILVTPIASNKRISFIDFDKKEREFISVREFFDNAYFSDGKEILERINRYDTSRVLYTFERKPLYYYRNLMLDFYEPTYLNREGYFEFTSSSSAFGWKAGDLKIDMGECYKYRNRELCEEKLVEFIKKQIEYSKEREEPFDF